MSALCLQALGQPLHSSILQRVFQVRGHDTRLARVLTDLVLTCITWLDVHGAVQVDFKESATLLARLAEVHFVHIEQKMAGKQT